MFGPEILWCYLEPFQKVFFFACFHRQPQSQCSRYVTAPKKSDLWFRFREQGGDPGLHREGHGGDDQGPQAEGPRPPRSAFSDAQSEECHWPFSVWHTIMAQAICVFLIVLDRFCDSLELWNIRRLNARDNIHTAMSSVRSLRYLWLPHTPRRSVFVQHPCQELQFGNRTGRNIEYTRLQLIFWYKLFWHKTSKKLCPPQLSFFQ